MYTCLLCTLEVTCKIYDDVIAVNTDNCYSKGTMNIALDKALFFSQKVSILFFIFPEKHKLILLEVIVVVEK